MEDLKHYVIKGGLEGRQRLRVLSRVMHPTTTALFDSLGIGGGMVCLDVGCAGGDVTMELARRTQPGGRAVGLDIDETKIALANWDLEESNVRNVEFHQLNIFEPHLAPGTWIEFDSAFDVVYARFLLTHLTDPANAIAVFSRCLKPGGLVIVEDIDFSGYFIHPDKGSGAEAFRRYRELYCTSVSKRGGDPNIGPRLPLLLKDAGFTGVGISVAQPVALEGEIKLINPLTMENIANTIIDDGLATVDEIEAIVRDLYDFAANPDTVAGLPRIVQTWGRRP
jgi:ubiquinone/menaquinone biosynthesis C-methylase UbiE